MNIDYKTFGVFRAILERAYHPRLADILVWMAVRYSRMVITEAYRPFQPGRSGTHSTDPVRAIDARSWIYPDPQGVADDINSAWRYDPDRLDMKVCVYHDIGLGPHFHIQAHDRTVQRVTTR